MMQHRRETQDRDYGLLLDTPLSTMQLRLHLSKMLCLVLYEISKLNNLWFQDTPDNSYNNRSVDLSDEASQFP
eukprot:3385088-Amphidinium_carterae.1